MDTQLPKGPFSDGRELLVVIAAAPVLFPRIFESVLQPLSALVFDLKTHMFGREDETVPGKVTGLTGSEDKDIEGWRADEEHHEQFLRRLGTYRRVVVLSGDVHFASTLTLDFWGKDDNVLDSRIVQCTSSAARNQPDEKMRGLLRTLRIGQQLLRGVPCERLGWDGAHGVVLPPGASISPGRRGRLRRKPDDPAAPTAGLRAPRSARRRTGAGASRWCATSARTPSCRPAHRTFPCSRGTRATRSRRTPTSRASTNRSRSLRRIRCG